MCALVDFAQSGQGLVVCEQKKEPIKEAVLEELNSPKSTLLLRQKRGVVFLKIGEFPTAISN